MKPTQYGVYIKWLDSAGTPGWLHPDEVAPEPMECETLGWLVKESKTALVIALNGCFNGDSTSPFGNFITIPKSVVTKRRPVKIH